MNYGAPMAINQANGVGLKSKRDVTAAGHYAAIACEAAPLHFHGSSSSIFVLG
jgi:hypothetical protein